MSLGAFSQIVAFAGTLAATSTAAEESQKIEEVFVLGARRAPGVVSVSTADVRLTPGAFGDPFRVVETLPGVTPLMSGLPFFYVRGSPPGNAGYFLDGVRVPLLYHIGFGPSVVQPALVGQLDVHRGGYPAHFGRFAGAIISADAAPPSSEIFGELNLRLYDVGGLVEAPFAEGRGTVLAGGRYSYTAAILSVAQPDITLDYRDYQARATYAITPDDVASVFAFGSYDFLAEKKSSITNVLFASEFYRADLRFDHRFDDGSFRAAITLGYDRGGFSELAGEQRHVVDRSICGRFELKSTLDEQVLLRAGADAQLDQFDAEAPKYSDPDSPTTLEFGALFPSRRDSLAGAWIELRWEPAPGVIIEPGLRTDLFASASTLRLGADPRLAANIAVHDAVRVLGSFGIAHQPPSFPIPIPGLAPAQRDQRLQRTIQGDFGVEVDLDADTTASLTVFDAAFFGLTDAFGTAKHEEGPRLSDVSDGTAFGVEVYVKRRLSSRIGGFLAYTLSRSARTFGGQEIASAFDRTHVASAALSYDWGSDWRSGARVVFYTGAPVVEETETGPQMRRARAFFRLDLRVEKRWTLDDTTWISLVLEMLNATFSKEVFGPENDEVGPIVIPNLGVEAGF